MAQTRFTFKARQEWRNMIHEAITKLFNDNPDVSVSFALLALELRNVWDYMGDDGDVDMGENHERRDEQEMRVAEDLL